MKQFILACVMLVGISALVGCGGSKVDHDTFYTMVEEEWKQRKATITDSMKTACEDRHKNDIKSAVDSVLSARGLK